MQSDKGGDDMTSRGWILAFRASKSSPAQYWFYKSKSSAESDAERLRSKGWEVVKLIPCQSNCNVITKEETK